MSKRLSFTFCHPIKMRTYGLWYFVLSKAEAKIIFDILFDRKMMQRWHLTFFETCNILEEVTKIFPIWFVTLYFIGCCYDNDKSLHIHKFFSWAHKWEFLHEEVLTGKEHFNAWNVEKVILSNCKLCLFTHKLYVK